jgi:hypothetical protein
MNANTRLGSACLAVILLSGVALAQADKPVEPSLRYYRLDFVVKELEGGKTVNARAYSTTISNERGAMSSIRTGSRVPMPGKEGTVSYMDVGINFDCRAAKWVDNDLVLNVSADISSVADGSSSPPVIRNNRWSGDVIVPLRKATIIFSSDDAMSKRQMQLELTATPLTSR